MKVCYNVNGPLGYRGVNPPQTCFKSAMVFWITLWMFLLVPTAGFEILRHLSCTPPVRVSQDGHKRGRHATCAPTSSHTHPFASVQPVGATSKTLLKQKVISNADDGDGGEYSTGMGGDQSISPQEVLAVVSGSTSLVEDRN